MTEGWLGATILQHPATPHRLPAELPSRGATLYPHRVYLAPEGSIGEETKSVKKRAALLHVLAFCFFDHNFGVPRGEQPLGRGSLPRNSETFFVSFFGHKKGKPGGGIPLPKVSRRKVAANALTQKNIAIPSRIVYDIG